MDLEIPGYKLLRTLGKGGMATVYLAQQLVFEREVALKVMSKSLAEDPTFGQRFFREAKIVSQLVHPNIVTVHDAGVHEGMYFLSMEYIDGHDLKFLRKKLTLAQKLKVVRDIASALDYAGSKGFVHRDIKPENIMFRGTDGSAVLTDFGIARAVKTDLSVTQTGTAIGTPHYMSPEQAKGKAVDHRSDLYSLGVVFYQLLTGRVPYDAESAVAIGVKHITEPVPKLPGRMAILQGPLEHLMAKNPDHRYQRGSEFIEDLDRLNLDKFNTDSSPAIGAGEDLEETPTDVTELPTERFTLEFETDEDMPKSIGSFLPGFFATIFVVIAVLGFIYVLRPAPLEPYIVRVEEKAGPLLQNLREKTGHLFAQLQSKMPADTDHKSSGAKAANNKTALPQPTPTPTPELAPAQISNSPASDAENQLGGDASVADSPDVAEAGQGPAEVEDVDGARSLPMQSDGASLDKGDEMSEQDRRAADIEKAAQEEKAKRDAELSRLMDEFSTLRGKFDSDPTLLPAFAKLHYDILKLDPENSEIQASLNNLRQAATSKILMLASQGQKREAESRLSEFKLVFPDTNASQLQDLDKKVKEKLTIESLLARARERMKGGYFLQPAGNNAFEIYRAVLRIDAQNLEARQGMQRLSSALTAQAKTKSQSGNTDAALDLLQKAMDADPDNKSASKLNDTLVGQQNHQLAVAAVLKLARDYRDKGQLYSPLNENAYDQYSKVLQLDPGNTAATSERDALVDALSTRAWSLVGSEQFDQARALLQRPRDLLKDNKRVQSLVLAVEQVIQDKSHSKQ